MRKVNIISSALLISLAVFFMYFAKKLPNKITGSGLGPGVVPFWLAFLLGTLAIILALYKDPDNQFSGFEKKELLGVGTVFFSQCLYVSSIVYLGYGTATALFVAYMSNSLGRFAWWKCFAFGVTVSLVTVLIFRNFLGLPLSPGMTGF